MSVLSLIKYALHFMKLFLTVEEEVDNFRLVAM